MFAAGLVGVGFAFLHVSGVKSVAGGFRSSSVQRAWCIQFHMNRTFLISTVASALMLAAPASADVRELGRNEIRENVRLGKSMSLNDLMSIVAARVKGEVMDVRAFSAGDVFYRVLIKMPDGQLGAVVLNAKSGEFVPSGSNVSKAVRAAASQRSSGSGNAATKAAARSDNRGGSSGGNGNSGGKGNGGGNSGDKGNSGGNGGGNSGGNGGGNSGGNGGGNSGGNGAGNSGGNGGGKGGGKGRG